MGKLAVPQSVATTTLLPELRSTYASGEVLAVGNLAVGLYRQNETYDFISDCEFPFTVAGVPDDRVLYLVDVSHRGEMTYPRDKLNEPVNLTLG
jgi:hypothetical protein